MAAQDEEKNGHYNNDTSNQLNLSKTGDHDPNQSALTPNSNTSTTFGSQLERPKADIHPYFVDPRSVVSSQSTLDSKLERPKADIRPYFVDPPSVVSSQSIIRHEEYTCVVFRIPAGHVIPLHNHPDMHVLGKVLFGKLKVEAFDVAEDEATAPCQVGTRYIRQ